MTGYIQTNINRINVINYAQYSLIFWLILSLLSACTLESNEPPNDIGIGAPGAVFYKTSLLRVDKEQGIAFYNVEYPAYNLSSTAKINIKELHPLMMEQVFKEKWKIIYEYKDDINKYHKIPSGFTIFAYSGADKYDDLVSKYELSDLTASVPKEMTPSQTLGTNLSKEYFYEVADKAEYTNKNGNKRIFKVIYFNVGTRQVNIGGWPMSY